MTDRREDESLRDWLVRAEADAEDLGRAAQAENDEITTLRSQAKAWTYRRVLAELDRDLGDACPDVSAHSELTAWAAGTGTLVRTLYLHGHRLFDEGRVFRGTDRCGEGRCACGLLSPILDSDADRKRWHRRHLVRVLDGATG